MLYLAYFFIVLVFCVSTRQVRRYDIHLSGRSHHMMLFHYCGRGRRLPIINRPCSKAGDHETSGRPMTPFSCELEVVDMLYYFESLNKCSKAFFVLLPLSPHCDHVSFLFFDKILQVYYRA